MHFEQLYVIGFGGYDVYRESFYVHVYNTNSLEGVFKYLTPYLGSSDSVSILKYKYNSNFFQNYSQTDFVT